MKVNTTITEALAELKTLDKKIESSKKFVMDYSVRQGTTIDPLDDEGGSDKVIPQKMQSIDNLLERKIAIRKAINASNQNAVVEINKVKRTVEEWLIWKRDVYQKEMAFLESLQRKIVDARSQCVAKGMTLRDDGGQPSKVTEVSSFIKESNLQRRIEETREIYGVLDGKLSLFNATTTILI